MGKGNFTEEFKRDAVRQITERGYPVAESLSGLGLASIRSTNGRRSSARRTARPATRPMRSGG